MITIVTAFFDIGRGNWPRIIRGRELPPYQHRPNEVYFHYFNKLAKMKNPMVIFTQPEFEHVVHQIRDYHGNKDKTEVVVVSREELSKFNPKIEQINNVMNNDEFVLKINDPHLPEYWNAPYVMINFLKSWFAAKANEEGLIKTDLSAWIDFGYVRDDSSLSPSLLWDYDFNPEKIHMFQMRDIEKNRPLQDIIATGDVYIQGCHIVAHRKNWDYLWQSMQCEIDKALNANLIDDDQTFLLQSYLNDPNRFELHPGNSNNWFIIFNKYNNKKEVL